MDLFHFRNECRNTTGLYSCAIDTILEVIYFCIYKSLGFSHLINAGPFLALVKQSCLLRDKVKSEADLRNIRNPVWDWCVHNIGSFNPKGTINAALTDTLAFLKTTNDEKNLFSLGYDVECKCVACDDKIHLPTRNFCPFYLSHENLRCNNYSVNAALTSDIENPFQHRPIIQKCTKCLLPQRTLTFTEMK